MNTRPNSAKPSCAAPRTWVVSPVGIVANQKTAVKARGRLEVGGVIYGDAADQGGALRPQLQPRRASP